MNSSYDVVKVVVDAVDFVVDVVDVLWYGMGRRVWKWRGGMKVGIGKWAGEVYGNL